MGKGLDAAPGMDLNTRGGQETIARKLRRLQQPMQPVEPDEPDDFMEIDEVYSPMMDAKCFNDDYLPPPVNKEELYEDFVKIFDWGLENPKESPLFAMSTGVSSNRFAGMCWRMVFHDNTIVGDSIAEYVSDKIDPVTKEWTGPYTIIPTSGLDASVLTCKPERLHPNNNYDQTASRILYAFQTSDEYPVGPGIKDSAGSGTSLISKYGVSYADLLHSCTVAATRYLIDDEFALGLEIEVSDEQLTDLLNIVENEMDFGRKDACYFSTNEDVLADELAANNRHPLCGVPDILPGVNLDATSTLR